MVTISTQRELRAVQKLGFCYLCGLPLVRENRNRDHVPPENIFAVADRNPPLLLPTHVECNSAHKLTDEKIGQLIALKRRHVPSSPEHRRLRFTLSPGQGLSAVNNLDLDGAIWRWIKGFHAALYGEFMPDTPMRALVTPLPKAVRLANIVAIEPLRQQHLLAVRLIKTNRVKRNLDTIRTNNGKFTYECVWGQSDDDRAWLCFFAINIYDWKDLGEPGIPPQRGCAGLYVLPDGGIPGGATKAAGSALIIPNLDPFDPFGP